MYRRCRMAPVLTRGPCLPLSRILGLCRLGWCMVIPLLGPSEPGPPMPSGVPWCLLLGLVLVTSAERLSGSAHVVAVLCGGC